MLAGFGLMTRGKQPQFVSERFQIPVLQYLVKPNQIRARITQNGATGLNAEEHRCTSRKRFEPSPGANIMGEHGDDLVCQVGFTPEPFHSGGRVGRGQFEVEQGAHGESMLPRDDVDMNRIVIKGRGENRGKYLCYSRMAGLAPGGFVWLSEQRKAARWDKRRCKPDYYEGKLACEHNGFFVRLVAKKSVRARIDELKEFILSKAVGAKERPDCYWLNGDWSGDESPDYCLECARKEVNEAFGKNPKLFKDAYGDLGADAEDYYRYAIDGGWSMDHDSIPHCEKCDIELDGTLTDHGVNEEIKYLTAKPGIRIDDVESWYCLNIAVMNLPRDDPRWNKIARMIDAIRANTKSHV